MDWFRMYADVLNDPRLQRLPGEMVKGWLNLIFVASQHDPRWALPPLSVVSFKLHTTPTKVQKLLNNLVAAGLLNLINNVYQFTEWSQRQFASDDAMKRKRAQRSRQRKDHPPDEDDEEDDHVDHVDHNDTMSRDNVVTGHGTTLRHVTTLDQIRSDQIRDQIRAEAEAEVDQRIRDAAAAAATIYPDLRTDIKKEQQAEIIALYEDTMDQKPPDYIQTELFVAIDLQGFKEVKDTLEDAQRHNIRSWAYCEAILHRKAQENGLLRPPPSQAGS